MDIFFDALARTNSKEKSIDAVKAVLLKRKLNIMDDERSYEELKVELVSIQKLIDKEKILSKLNEK